MGRGTGLGPWPRRKVGGLVGAGRVVLDTLTPRCFTVTGDLSTSTLVTDYGGSALFAAWAIEGAGTGVGTHAHVSGSCSCSCD